MGATFAYRSKCARQFARLSCVCTLCHQGDHRSKWEIPFVPGRATPKRVRREFRKKPNLLVVIEVVVRPHSGDEEFILQQEDCRSKNERSEQVHMQTVTRTLKTPGWVGQTTTAYKAEIHVRTAPVSFERNVCQYVFQRSGRSSVFVSESTLQNSGAPACLRRDGVAPGELT